MQVSQELRQAVANRLLYNGVSEQNILDATKTFDNLILMLDCLTGPLGVNNQTTGLMDGGYAADGTIAFGQKFAISYAAGYTVNIIQIDDLIVSNNLTSDTVLTAIKYAAQVPYTLAIGAPVAIAENPDLVAFCAEEEHITHLYPLAGNYVQLQTTDDAHLPIKGAEQEGFYGPI